MFSVSFQLIYPKHVSFQLFDPKTNGTKKKQFGKSSCLENRLNLKFSVESENGILYAVKTRTFQKSLKV